MIRTWSAHPLASAYLERVCAQVRAKKMHEEIRLELINHLDELVEGQISDGIEEQEAVKQALVMLGDAEDVGKRLHSVHKPLMEWGLLGIVAALVGVGLLAMYAIDMALGDSFGGGWFFKKAIVVFAGVLLLIVFYYIDFRKLRPYSWYLYGLVIILLLLCKNFGIQINGARIWIIIGSSFSINVYELALYGFLIAFAGCVTSIASKSRHGFRLIPIAGKFAFAFVIVPVWFFVDLNRYLLIFIYFVGLVMILTAIRKFHLLVGVVIAFIGIAAGMLVISGTHSLFMLQHVFSRLRQFKGDPQTTGYYWRLIVENLQSAGMWGHGFGVPNTKLPFIYSDSIYSYLIYSLGWVFGAFLLLLTMTFVFRLAALGLKLNDSYAKAVTAGICSVFAIHAVWNILMSLGILPIVGVSFPFVSYGLTNSIFELALIGLLLGLYRRKNMLGATEIVSTN